MINLTMTTNNAKSFEQRLPLPIAVEFDVLGFESKGLRH